VKSSVMMKMKTTSPSSPKPTVVNNLAGRIGGVSPAGVAILIHGIVLTVAIISGIHRAAYLIIAPIFVIFKYFIY
jgi:hypothetical protein